MTELVVFLMLFQKQQSGQWRRTETIRRLYPGALTSSTKSLKAAIKTYMLKINHNSQNLIDYMKRMNEGYLHTQENASLLHVQRSRDIHQHCPLWCDPKSLAHRTIGGTFPLRATIIHAAQQLTSDAYLWTVGGHASSSQNAQTRTSLKKSSNQAWSSADGSMMLQ